MELPRAKRIELADGRLLRLHGHVPRRTACLYATDDQLRVAASLELVKGWGRTLWVSLSRESAAPTEADIAGVARAFFPPGSSVVRLDPAPGGPVHLALPPGEVARSSQGASELTGPAAIV